VIDPTPVIFKLVGVASPMENCEVLPWQVNLVEWLQNHLDRFLHHVIIFSSSGFSTCLFLHLPDQKTAPSNPQQKLDRRKSLANEQVYSSNIISPEGLEHGNRHANGRDHPLPIIVIKTARSKD
jgi:hypothetical protein